MIDSIPYSFKAEQEVLATVLVSPECISRLACLLSEEDFHISQHKACWTSMVETQKRHGTADLVLIMQTAQDMGLWERLGGSRVLSELLDRVGFTSHMEQYADVLRGKTLQRRVLDASRELEDTARDDKISRDQRLAASDRVVRSIFTHASVGGLAHGKHGVEEHSEAVTYATGIGGGIVGIRSGIDSLDNQLGGLRDGWQVLVMAGAGMGKSAFAINNLALSCAREGRSVAIFSLEMTQGQVMGRLIAAESGVPYHVQCRGQMKERDEEEYGRALPLVAELPVFVDEGDGLGLDALSARARSLAYERGNLGLIVLDYIQLMEVDMSKRSFNRTEEIAAITRTLKRLAKELGCVVVTLSQPTAEGARSERLTLAHAKGAQAIGADVDVAILINKDKKGDVVLDVAKFRHGPPFALDSTEVRWNGARMQFMNGSF